MNPRFPPRHQRRPRRRRTARRQWEIIPVILAVGLALAVVLLTANARPARPVSGDTGSRDQEAEHRSVPEMTAVRPTSPPAAAVAPTSPPAQPPPLAHQIVFPGPRSAKLVLASPVPIPASLAVAVQAWQPPRPPLPTTSVTVERTTFSSLLPGNATVTVIMLSGRGLSEAQRNGTVCTPVFFGPYVGQSEQSIVGDPVNRRLIDAWPAVAYSVLVKAQDQHADPGRYYSHPDAGLFPVIEQGRRWVNRRIGRPPDSPAMAWGESAGASLVGCLIDVYPGRYSYACLFGGDRFTTTVRDQRAERLFLCTRGDHNWTNTTDFMERCRGAGATRIDALLFPPNPWQRGQVHYHHSPGPVAHDFIAGRLGRQIERKALPGPDLDPNPVVQALRQDFTPLHDPHESLEHATDPAVGRIPDLGLRDGTIAGDGRVWLAMRRRDKVAGLIVVIPPRPMIVTDPIRDNLLRLAELGFAAVFPDMGCSGSELAHLLGTAGKADRKLPILVVIDGLNARGTDRGWLTSMLAPLPHLPVVVLSDDMAKAPVPPALAASDRLSVLGVSGADNDTANFAVTDVLPLLVPAERL